MSPAEAKRIPVYISGQSAPRFGPLLGIEDNQAQGGVAAAPEPDAVGSAEASGLQRESKQTEAIGQTEEQHWQKEGGLAGEEIEGEQTADRQPVEPVAHVAETGETEQLEAYGRSLRLQGRTRARFRNSFRTADVVTEPGEGCGRCRGRGCVHVTGTLESTYSVATSVTLPSVPRNLTPCQRARVRDAIDTVLAPHEQEHVDAFNTYNGMTSTPFDMTICRNTFNARIRAMHNSEARARRAAAQALSDALDPFNFDVDLDCQETAVNEAQHTTAGAQNPDEMA